MNPFLVVEIDVTFYPGFLPKRENAVYFSELHAQSQVDCFGLRKYTPLKFVFSFCCACLVMTLPNMFLQKYLLTAFTLKLSCVGLKIFNIKQMVYSWSTPNIWQLLFFLWSDLEYIPCFYPFGILKSTL